MTPLSTHDRTPAEKAPTTRAVSRSWLRGGLLRDLSWAEAFVLLQVAWNEPARAHSVFGLEERYRRRCLSRLLEKGYIEKSDEGYVLHAEAHAGEDQTWVWLWPLRWHIPLREKIVFILLDEQTRGRRWVNRSQLAQQLGIDRTTLYDAMDALYDEGLAWPVGKGGKIVCFNHAEDLKADTMERLLAHPGYIRDESEDDEEAIVAAFKERVARQHREGRAPTLGGPAANTRIHSGFALDSPTPRRGAGEDQSSARTWVLEAAQSLARVCYRRMKDSGAEKVPTTRVLEGDILALLDPHRGTAPHLRAGFLKEMTSRLEGCTSFMWTRLLPDLSSIVSSASVHAVRDERVERQAAESLRDSLHGLVEDLKHHGLYDAGLLSQPERLGGLPRIKALIEGCVVAGIRGTHLPPEVVALDPVLGEAWGRVSEGKAGRGEPL